MAPSRLRLAAVRRAVARQALLAGASLASAVGRSSSEPRLPAAPRRDPRLPAGHTGAALAGRSASKPLPTERPQARGRTQAAVVQGSGMDKEEETGNEPKKKEQRETFVWMGLIRYWKPRCRLSLGVATPFSLLSFLIWNDDVDTL